MIVTDRLRSYRAAMSELGNATKQNTGRWLNNRAENSHLPFRRRERAMQRFRTTRSLQKFTSIHSSVTNHFNLQRHLITRDDYKTKREAALIEWQQLYAAKIGLSDGKLRRVRIRLTAPSNWLEADQRDTAPYRLLSGSMQPPTATQYKIDQTVLVCCRIKPCGRNLNQDTVGYHTFSLRINTW